MVLKPKLWTRIAAQKPQKTKALREIDQHTNTGGGVDTQAGTSLNTNERLEALSLTGSTETSLNALIKLKDSITNDLNWCLADAGLFNSRRFRVNWSLYPTASTYTQLSNYSRHLTYSNKIQLANFDQCTVAISLDEAKLSQIRANCEVYLRIQLELSDMIAQQNSLASQNRPVRNHIPLFRTKYGNELIKRCCECTQEIRNSIGNVLCLIIIIDAY
jgi:hypothetical protein